MCLMSSNLIRRTTVRSRLNDVRVAQRLTENDNGNKRKHFAYCKRSSEMEQDGNADGESC